MTKLRIATRKSPLALRQSELVGAALRARHPNLTIELCPFSTQGDENLTANLAEIGGKGLFIKALEQAILEDKADIAVHSAKDMPAELLSPFAMMTALPRADARDVLVCSRYHNFKALPSGARVGTSSLRRQAQLHHSRADIIIEPLRGNINTRLKKLEQGQYDAIVLAAAGLERLDLRHVICQYFNSAELLPAIGQAALMVEYHQEKQEVADVIKTICDIDTQQCISAERVVAQHLHADCHSPVAAHACILEDELNIHALVASVDGKKVITATAKGTATQAERLGKQVAVDLIDQGANTFIHHHEISE
ncbi:MAG: hydroxymethylbilane synthase [Pseudomonadota bacterium]